MADRDRVAVVGAGIAGLATAEAFARAGSQVTLLEASDVLGGRIASRRQGDYLLEAGPDGYSAGSPALEGLIDRLGLRPDVVDVAPGWAGLVREGRVIRLPTRLFAGVPVDAREIVGLGALAIPARLRLLAEPLVPARRSGPPESLEKLLYRRLGAGAARDLVGPLLAGVHAGRAAELDAAVVAPQLVEAERTWGSILRAGREAGLERRPGRALRSLEDGMGRLVQAVESYLGSVGASICRSSAVRSLERGSAGWSIELNGGGSAPFLGPFDFVVLAVPPRSVAQLLAPLDQGAAAGAASVESADAVLVHAVFAGPPAEPTFHGAIVPPGERGDLSSFSVVSAKWPGRAPAGETLLRVSLRPEGDPDRALEAIARLLGMTARPRILALDVAREAFPVQKLGHGVRVAAIKKAVASMGDLALVGAAWDATGLESLVSAANGLVTRASPR